MSRATATRAHHGRRLLAQLALGASATLIALAGTARADGPVVVRTFDGPFAARVRAIVVDELQARSIDVIDESKASAAASKHDVQLDTVDGRVAVAKELGASAFIEGHTAPLGSRRAKVELVVYAGTDGAQLTKASFAALKAKVGKVAKGHVWKDLGSEIAAAKPPSAEPVASAKHEPVEEVEEAPAPIAKPEPKNKAKEREATEDAAEEAEVPAHAGGRKPSPFDASVGVRMGNRRFTYNDPFPGLRGYKLGLAPEIGLQLHWYPVAHFSDGFAANIGLDLRGEMLVGVKSKNSSGQEFSTSSRELGVGLRIRFPLGSESEAGTLLGYGMHSFALGEAKGVSSGVPDVDYGFVRMGGDVHLALFGPLSLRARAAFLLGLSQGEIASDAWFPHTSQNGVEAEGGFGFGLSKNLEAQALFSIQRYFMSFDPRINDPSVQSSGRVAGGALDQYLSVYIALLWKL